MFLGRGTCLWASEGEGMGVEFVWKLAVGRHEKREPAREAIKLGPAASASCKTCSMKHSHFNYHARRV